MSPPAIAELLPADSPTAYRRQRSTKSSATSHTHSLTRTRRTPTPHAGEPPLISKPVALLVRPESSPLLGRLAHSAKTKGARGKGPFASWSRALGTGGVGQAFAHRLRAGSAPLGGRGRYGQAASLRSRSTDRHRGPVAQAVSEVTEVSPGWDLPTLRPEAREPGFHLELQRVSVEVSEVRRRQLSTRNRLERYRAAAAGGVCATDQHFAFRRGVEDVKIEVRSLLDDFLEDWDSLQPVNEELEALAQEADALVETDVRISELLSRMSRKVDFFEQTLGSSHIR